MLKGKFEVAEGGLMLLLGLTNKNIETLKQGKPIAINAEKDFGISGLRIVLAQGKDEAEIKQWIQTYFNLIDKQTAQQLLDIPEPN
jgi:hypothetical protein